jgi:short-subunit dehydrogenase
VWKNKVVWITGASSGIGASLVRESSRRGAIVVATSRNRDALQRVADSCTGEVLVIPADLTHIEGLPGLVETVQSLTNHIDTLILNAGVSQRSPAVDTSREVSAKIFALNTLAPMELTRLVLPEMMARGEGNVVAVSSLAGRVGFPLRSTYCASKHALHGYFEALRAETADRGVTVTVAVPGFVNTEISKKAVRGDGSAYGRMDENQDAGISPDKCAFDILDAVAGGKLEVSSGLGVRGRAALMLHAVAPRFFSRIIQKARPT